MSSFDKILHEVFGFTSFRKGQREALEALFSTRAGLVHPVDRHGKSLLYQLPSCLLEGITLVISPLLALMRDQLGHLSTRFKIEAASINSDQTEEENALARSAAYEGKARILFISPEQIDHIDRFDFLSKLKISLFVVDEAHCISTWGHDFRPGYRQILHFIEALENKNPHLKVLALTATADERVEADLKRQLSTAKTPLHILREEMDRPNIHLSTLHAKSIAEKLLLCEMLLQRFDGSGLIYTATRENAELVAEFLKNHHVKAIAYHAGLESEEKRKIQNAFVEDQYKVVAATTALGMGIDKANLRFIIHFDIPGSITSYYQEVGRCGRDGKKAEGILLYHVPDKKIQEYFIDAALPSSENFEQIFEAVKTAEEPPNLTAIKRVTGLHPTRVTIVLAELIEQGLLKKESLKGVQVYRCSSEALTIDLSRYTNQHLVKTEELNKMLAFAEEKDACRMALLRAALGDISPPPCGRCDNCLNVHAAPELEPSKNLPAFSSGCKKSQCSLLQHALTASKKGIVF